jgi:hypothetical protein
MNKSFRFSSHSSHVQIVGTGHVFQIKRKKLLRKTASYLNNILIYFNCVDIVLIVEIYNRYCTVELLNYEYILMDSS